MRYVSCTIETGDDFWVVSVPADAVENAGARLSELLSGTRRRIVFLDRKTEFTITTESAVCNGRCVPITKDWLECLEKLFTRDIRPGISHLDWEFSNQHMDIAVFIQ